jgi:hypothetical protein
MPNMLLSENFEERIDSIEACRKAVFRVVKADKVGLIGWLHRKESMS